AELHLRHPLAQLGDLRGHVLVIGAKRRVADVDLAFENRHAASAPTVTYRPRGQGASAARRPAPAEAPAPEERLNRASTDAVSANRALCRHARNGHGRGFSQLKAC